MGPRLRGERSFAAGVTLGQGAGSPPARGKVAISVAVLNLVAMGFGRGLIVRVAREIATFRNATLNFSALALLRKAIARAPLSSSQPFSRGRMAFSGDVLRGVAKTGSKHKHRSTFQVKNAPKPAPVLDFYFLIASRNCSSALGSSIVVRSPVSRPSHSAWIARRNNFPERVFGNAVTK